MIRVFDLNINFLTEIDDYESLVFERNYYTHSMFELHINENKKDVHHLIKNNIISIGKNLTKCGIIKVVERSAENTEEIIISGFSLDFLFSSRVIIPVAPSAYDSIIASVETSIKHYINNCIVDPVDPKRKLDFFNLIEDCNRGAVSEYNARGEFLSEYVSQIRKQHEMGISIVINRVTNKLDVDVMIGEDHRAGQEKPVIFSTDYDNISKQLLYQSDVEEKNFAYVYGQGEGVDRELVTVGDYSGINRKELIVESRSSTDSLISEGETELAQYPEIFTFETEILNRQPFVYERDFNLGDLVTVTNKKWSIRLDTRITEIREIYEAKKLRVEVVFGNNIPTLKDVLKGKLKKEVK